MRLQVKNSAGEDTRDGVYITSTNEEDIVGSRGTCNFQIKWVRDAKSAAHAEVLETIKDITRRQLTGMYMMPPFAASRKGMPQGIQHLLACAEEDSGKWVPIVGFDCRGLEPVAFHAENGWKAVSTGGTVFEDVDLRDDWADFCDKADESVGVYSLEGRFVRK
jgi:hypothetical protein